MATNTRSTRVASGKLVPGFHNVLDLGVDHQRGQSKVPESMKAGDCVLLDRDSPSTELISLMQAKEAAAPPAPPAPTQPPRCC